MRVTYINGIPVNDGYAQYLDRYLSPRERALVGRNIEDTEYEDSPENDNDNEETD